MCQYLNFIFLHSWPSKETRADDILNIGPRSLFLALKPNTSLVFAVEQLAYILTKEIAKTIIKVGLEKDQIIAALRKTEIAERVHKHYSGLMLSVFMFFTSLYTE